jgi:hypothetical protein
MRLRRAALWVALAPLGVVAGCQPSLSTLDTGPLTETFAVSDIFTPSGYMGDGMYFGSLTATVNQGCKPRPQGARGDCYVFTYYTNEAGASNPWAGVYWVFPANNWGSGPGHAIDTSRFQQIRFSAAVEAVTPYTDLMGMDGSLDTFAGKLDPHGQYDTLGTQLMDPSIRDHLDGFGLVVSSKVGIDVGPELKPFHLPITDTNRSFNCGTPAADCQNGVAASIVGAFGWSIPYPAKGDPTRTSAVRIYLDDIVWDTEPPPPP